MNELFFELIRISLGNQDEFSHTPSESEWNELFNIAEKQALLGICFVGVQHLWTKAGKAATREQQTRIIPEDTYYDWLITAGRIRSRNQKMAELCDKMCRTLNRDGMHTVVLKGLGVAKYYGEHADFRQSGDIDVWLWPKGDWTLRHDERMCRVIQYLRSICHCGRPTYHNIAAHFFKSTYVEVHYTPSWLYSPIHNHRMQRWFEQSAPEEMAQQFSTLRFNMVYILMHIYRHLFGEGIGLRQVMDYYHVLKAADGDEKLREEAVRRLRSFGAMRFTGGLMYILKTVMGLEDKYLLCAPDAKEGMFILSEMVQAGNFGKFDKRIDRQKADKGLLTGFRMHVVRNLHFISHYPTEVLWCPLWKIWHQLWLRKFQKS